MNEKSKKARFSVPGLANARRQPAGVFKVSCAPPTRISLKNRPALAAGRNRILILMKKRLEKWAVLPQTKLKSTAASIMSSLSRKAGRIGYLHESYLLLVGTLSRILLSIFSKFMANPTFRLFTQLVLQRRLMR